MEKIAVQRLFKQYYVAMFRVARTLLFDEQECKDVVSDIFEHLLSENIVLLPDTEEHYLMASVRNQCIKRLHHEEVRRQFESIAQVEEKASRPVRDERLYDIEEYVRQALTPQQQRIFSQRFVHGFSYEEIAESEGISKVAVWKHLSQITTRIKQHFNPQAL